MRPSQIQPVLLIVCCFGLCVSLGYAQNDPPIYPVDGEFIKQWLLLGPFFPGDLETDFLVAAGGEANQNSLPMTDGHLNGYLQSLAENSAGTSAETTSFSVVLLIHQNQSAVKINLFPLHHLNDYY